MPIMSRDEHRQTDSSCYELRFSQTECAVQAGRTSRIRYLPSARVFDFDRVCASELSGTQVDDAGVDLLLAGRVSFSCGCVPRAGQLGPIDDRQPRSVRSPSTDRFSESSLLCQHRCLLFAHRMHPCIARLTEKSSWERTNSNLSCELPSHRTRVGAATGFSSDGRACFLRSKLFQSTSS